MLTHGPLDVQHVTIAPNLSVATASAYLSVRNVTKLVIVKMEVTRVIVAVSSKVQQSFFICTDHTNQSQLHFSVSNLILIYILVLFNSHLTWVIYKFRHLVIPCH